MSARRGRRAKDGDTLVVLGSCRSGRPVSRTPVHHPALSQSLASRGGRGPAGGRRGVDAFLW
jgi:hypothetical protein